MHGENAISELQEIMNITAYEDIKNACAEAIKSMRAGSKVETNETSSTNDSNSRIDVTTIAKDQKKEKIENDPQKRVRDLNQVS